MPLCPSVRVLFLRDAFAFEARSGGKGCFALWIGAFHILIRTFLFRMGKVRLRSRGREMRIAGAEAPVRQCRMVSDENTMLLCSFSVCFFDRDSVEKHPSVSCAILLFRLRGMGGESFRARNLGGNSKDVEFCIVRQRVKHPCASLSIGAWVVWRCSVALNGFNAVCRIRVVFDGAWRRDSLCKTRDYWIGGAFFMFERCRVGASGHR